jgi:hypothetical protein
LDYFFQINRRGGKPFASPFFEFDQCVFKPLGFDGFQQIIERIYFKRPQSVFVKSGRKDYRRIIFEFGEQLKTVQIRHLNVEKKRVERKRRAAFRRLKRVRSCRRRFRRARFPLKGVLSGVSPAVRHQL